MRRWATLVSILALGVLSPVAWGQEEPEAAEQQPEQRGGGEILRAADAAMGKLTSLAFTSTTRGAGGMAIHRPATRATGRLVRGGDKDGLGWKFLLRGQATRLDSEKAADFSVGYDGAVLRSVREADRAVLESAWESRKDTMDPAAEHTLAWLIQWRGLVSEPFRDPETEPKSRDEGEAIVEGVRCRVVYVDYSETAGDLLDAWWYIGDEDSLPRRVEFHHLDTGHGDGFAVTTLTSLEPDAPVDDKALALAIPEGFQVKKAEEAKPRRAARPDRSPGPKVGDMAPEWALKDPSGKEHKLADYRGKVVVLDFWATWCGPCRAAMPGVQKLHEKYGGQGVAVFGVNCWENADAAKFMKDEKYTYGLLLQGDEIAGKYGVNGIPAIFVIGPDGKVLYGAVGFEGEEVVEAAIKKGLKN